jgi:hypothetical protein
VIKDSTFSGGNSKVLELTPASGSIMITGVTFKNVNGGTAIVGVGSASEFMVRSTKFQDITTASAIAPTDGNYARNMFTLYDVTFDNVRSNANSILNSAFGYAYADGLTFVSCNGSAAFQVPWGGTQVPVLYDVLMDSCSFSRGNFLGIPNSYFVVVNGEMKNTQERFESYVRMYYENIVFARANGVMTSALVPNGPFSAMGCTFTGFELAVSAISTNEGCFVCRSTFEDCGTCFKANQEILDIVHCLFKDYTRAAIESLNGHQSGTFRVIGCVFISDKAPAILNSNTVSIVSCCFDRAGTVVQQGSGNKLMIGADCCIKSSSGVSGGTVSGTFGGCTKVCPSTVSESDTVCKGYSFSPRPTPLPTQSPIIIWQPPSTKMPIPLATKTPTPRATKTPTPLATKTPTPLATKTPTPLATKTPTPRATNTPMPLATETPTLIETETPTPIETETSTPIETDTPTPIETETPTPRETFSPLQTLSNSPIATESDPFASTESFAKTLNFIDSSSFQESPSFIPTIQFDPTVVLSLSDALDPTALLLPSVIPERSDLILESITFRLSIQPKTTLSFQISALFSASDLFKPSEEFTSSLAFTVSNQFTDSPTFLPSISFTASPVFAASAVFTTSDSFKFSNLFMMSLPFTSSAIFSFSSSFSESNQFTSSNQLTPSNVFTPSAPFTASGTKPVVALQPNVAEQITNGLLSKAGIGIGIGGLVALAALLLLFLLLKKKKEVKTVSDEEIVMDETETFNSDAIYISEYGLSDNGVAAELCEDQEDLPQNGLSDGNYASDQMNASELNPDDIDDGSFAPDEA